jgi:hypothetical protein
MVRTLIAMLVTAVLIATLGGAVVQADTAVVYWDFFWEDIFWGGCGWAEWWAMPKYCIDAWRWWPY